MLQEADPTGEGFIRLGDGIPIFAEPKEGYWDGPFAYIDENGNYIQSTKGYKIDIYAWSISEFVEQHFDFNDPNNWEYIKGMIKSDTTYANKADRDDKHDKLVSRGKKMYDELVAVYTKIRNK